MKELVRIDYSNTKPTVLGRDLHEFLEIKTPYHIWFPRMCEYGFIEKHDYITYEQKSTNVENRCFGDATGIKPKIDHQISISMAKELSMVQRNKKGKEARLYFIKCEEELHNQIRNKQQSIDKIFRDSIEARLKETGAIKKFIEYAIKSGSKGYKTEKNQNNCYATFTEYAYKAYFSNYKYYKNAVKGLCDNEKNLKQNLRNSENTRAIVNLSTIEQIIANVIDREIEKGTYYKDINKIVPKELKVVIDLLGTVKITSNELPSKCVKLLKGD